MTDELISSRLGQLLLANASKPWIQRRLLDHVVRAEGGQMRSASLRALLARGQVYVGAHSYGSLLVPGACDPHTHIGRYVSIGPGVRRFGASHPTEHASMHPYWYNPSLGVVDARHDVQRTRIDICHDSWIGANSVLLPKVERIGLGAVVAAGAVVTRSVEDFEMVAGNPARHVRFRFSDEVIDVLLEAAVWNLPPEHAFPKIAELNLSIELMDRRE